MNVGSTERESVRKEDEEGRMRKSEGRGRGRRPRKVCWGELEKRRIREWC